jgi:hypothetical protein
MRGYVGLVIIAAGGLLAWLLKSHLSTANTAHWNNHSPPADAYNKAGPSGLSPADIDALRQENAAPPAELGPLPQVDTALPGPQSSSDLAPQEQALA